MKKLIKIAAITLVLALLLCGCARGNIENVEYVVGESELFTEADITTAMDRAAAFFKAEFDRCTLIELSYSEAESRDAAAEWAESAGFEEAILLECVFSVDREGSSTNLSPDTYDHFSWVLGRRGGAPWQLITLGFAA